MQNRLATLSKLAQARKKVVKGVEGVLMDMAGAKKGMEAAVWENAGWEDEEVMSAAD